MAKKKVCISFDYENDKHYRYLLSAWDANTDFEFTFNDKTPGEIKSDDYSRLKAVLTQKINSASLVLVIVGSMLTRRTLTPTRLVRGTGRCGRSRKQRS